MLALGAGSRVHPSARRPPRRYTLRMAAGAVGSRCWRCAACLSPRPAPAQRITGIISDTFLDVQPPSTSSPRHR